MSLAATFFGMTISTAAVVALLKIIAIDIVLSGDNAIVIAMATRNLPREQRNKAILWGTGGAVILRILLAMIIVWLLKVPYVNLIGGLLLLWIALKVLISEEEEAHVSAQSGLLKAIGTIIMADFIMSLDNVVAVAGAADGHVLMIAVGVMISIPIMIFGSKFIVNMMDKHKWISYAGSGILAWTAGEMVLRDKHLTKLLHIEHGLATYAIAGALTVLVLAAGYTVNKKREAKRFARQH